MNDANAIVCPMIPAISHSRYSRESPPVMAIEPPNTKANSSTNMTGWMVTSSSISGIRLMWIRLRFVITSDWRSRPVSRISGRAIRLVSVVLTR